MSTQVQAVTKPLVSDADKPGFDETINSDSAIIINVGNGDVLYEKAADTQRAPASLIKLMTVYVAIKNCDDIDRELQMPKEAYKGLEEGSASQSGLKAGETVTVRDLLYAALLSSGGDAANALALVTSGNTKSFVDLMNDEALIARSLKIQPDLTPKVKCQPVGIWHVLSKGHWETPSLRKYLPAKHTPPQPTKPIQMALHSVIP